MIKKTTFIVITLLTNTILFAQIEYTDIPDSNLESVGPNWDPEGIDFNNDGTLEITTFDGIYLELFDPTYTFETCQLWASGTPAAEWDYIEAISTNTTIDVSGNFITLGDGSMDGWGAGTLFPLNQDAYIAVKIDLGGQTHYGWVRVMWNGVNFIYKDYAYNTTPNEAIDAGQQVLSIKDYKNNIEVSYYPNPTKDYVSIKCQKTIDQANLIDILGRTTKLNLNNNTIDVRNYPSGIYFLHIKAGKNTAIKKIIKM